MVKEYEDIIQPPEQFRDGYKPIPKPRTDDRLPLQMRRYSKPTRKAPSLPITQVEEHIIQPPEQFRDGYKPIPKPRTDRPLQMRRPPKPTRKPPPPPIPEGESSQHKITQLRKALKGSTKSFAVDVINIIDPMKQLNETKNFIKKCLVKELLELKGFKYIETLKVTFEKKQGNGIRLRPGCSHTLESSSCFSWACVRTLIP